MKKRIVSLLLAAAMLVLLAVPAFAEDGHAYTYVALGDSITTGVGLKDTHFSATAKSYDVPAPPPPVPPTTTCPPCGRSWQTLT